MGALVLRPKGARAERVGQTGALDNPPPAPSGSAGSLVERAQQRVTAPPPWEAIEPFGPGTPISANWRVKGLSDVIDGSAVLTLKHRSGRTAEVRLLRKGARPVGIAHTERLDMLLINRAKGGRRTAELLARVIRTMAARIAAHESRNPAKPAVLASLRAPRADYS